MTSQTRRERQPCVFCDIIEKGHYQADHGTVVSFIPLDPVTPGHTLFVPKTHFADAAEMPEYAGDVMTAAAEVARSWGDDANLITSIGPAATQSVFHMHLHLVPRRHGDGLALPWTGQRKQERTHGDVDPDPAE